MPRTNDKPATLLARYSAALYLLALLMVLMPPLDIILSLQQYVWGSARWRFGLIGLLSGAMLLPITGLLLASVTAVQARHRLIHRLTLFGGVLLAVGILVGMALFALDAIEVRRSAAPAVLRRYDLTVIKTVLMQLAQVVTIGLIARSALRSARSASVEPRADRDPELVAGVLGR